VWEVTYSPKAKRGYEKLNEDYQAVMYLLYSEIEKEGPYRTNWPNYGKLTGQKGEKYHCHLDKKKPRYVACWEILAKKNQIVRIYYVGTHQGAPY
jgi:mRNA-degrading endonuclease RelE of RelBE toxin-antitoxin system